MEIDSNNPTNEMNDAMQAEGGAAEIVEEADGSRALDLVFILDCTGSMGSYIAVRSQL